MTDINGKPLDFSVGRTLKENTGTAIVSCPRAKKNCRMASFSHNITRLSHAPGVVGSNGTFHNDIIAALAKHTSKE